MPSSLFQRDEISIELAQDPFWLHYSNAAKAGNDRADDDGVPLKHVAVSGRIKLKLKKARRISRLGVRLRCTAKLISASALPLRQIKAAPADLGAGGVISGEILHREFEQDINEELPAGDHLFAFQQYLTVCCPTTTRTRHGDIAYTVAATAESPNARTLTATQPVRIYKRLCSILGEAQPHLHRIGGQVDQIGLFRLYFASDGLIGGRWTFTLFLPMSAPEAQIWSIFAFIRQHETLYRPASLDPRDAEPEDIEEPLPMIFSLFRHGATDTPKPVNWPKPGLEGCEYSVQGRLPFHNVPLASSKQDLFAVSSSSRTVTPLRIAHDVVIGFEYSTAAFEPLRRVEFAKRVEYASCEIIPDFNELPGFDEAMADGGVSDVSKEALLCACQRQMEPLPALCGADVMNGEKVNGI